MPRERTRQRTIELFDPEELALQKLAENVEKAAGFGEAISKSSLKQETVVLLLHDATRVSKADIRKILDALPELKKKYLKPQT